MALTGSDLFIVGRGTTNYSITGTNLAAFIIANGLPSQAGHAGEFLTTDGTTLSWAAVSGAGVAASLAQAAAGVLNTVYSSPETAVPKDASGMAGAALLPGSAAAYGGAPVTGMIRYNNSAPPAVIEYYDGTAWVALSTGGGGGASAASLAQAAAGTLNTVYSSPETAVPKDASGMAGAALLPGSAAAYGGASVTGMIRYNNSTPPAVIEYYNGTTWVSLSTGGGGVSAASLAQAAAGTLNTVYSSPETAVPKNASGMTGAALIPGGNNAARPAAPVRGMLRYNNQVAPTVMEFYDGTAWVTIASGTIMNKVIYGTGNANTASFTVTHAAVTLTSSYIVLNNMGGGISDESLYVSGRTSTSFNIGGGSSTLFSYFIVYS